MSKAFDLLVLGVFWLIPTLPVLLIGTLLEKLSAPEPIWFLLFAPLLLLGPASTAFYYCVCKVIRKERGYLLKEYARSFRLNLKQGLIVMFIYIVIGLLMYFDVQYANQLSEQGSKFGSVMYGVFLVQAIFLVFTFIYIFPILSRFTVTLKQLFKWAFFFAVRHILFTLILVVLLAGCAVIMYYSFFFFPPLMLMLPGIYTLLSSFLIERVFKKYMPKQETDDETSGIDHWYNE